MDVGGALRHARTARQLSLADIAGRTKINQKILRAIEENRFDRVPGGLFTRGYLRAFAREVQLDPEEIVEQYRAEFEPPPVEVFPVPEESLSGLEIDSMASPDGGRDSSRGAGLAIVLLIAAAYFGFARSGTTASTPDSVPKPTDTAEAAVTARPPAATTGTLDAGRTLRPFENLRDAPSKVEGRQGSGPGAPLKLVIQPTADCWVAGTIDGKSAIARLMKAGERDQFDVYDRAALRIGDPSAFTFTLNGMPGRVAGTAHTAVNLTFDRQSYQSILREKPL